MRKPSRPFARLAVAAALAAALAAAAPALAAAGTPPRAPAAGSGELVVADHPVAYHGYGATVFVETGGLSLEVVDDARAEQLLRLVDAGRFHPADVRVTLVRDGATASAWRIARIDPLPAAHAPAAAPAATTRP